MCPDSWSGSGRAGSSEPLLGSKITAVNLLSLSTGPTRMILPEGSSVAVDPPVSPVHGAVEAKGVNEFVLGSYDAALVTQASPPPTCPATSR